MKFNLQEINTHSVASDTDSTFICLEPILRKKYPDLDLNNTEEVLEKIKPLQKEIGEKLNNYQSVIAKKLLNCNEHYFDLKPEYIVKKALWTGKRRYAQYLVDREGQRIDVIDTKGLELMKSNMNKLFKEFGEQLIKDILFGKLKSEIDNNIVEFYKTLKTLDPKTLGKPTGVKQISAYRIPVRAGEIFSSFRLKAPANTKAAVRYNDLLKFKKLDTKYESVIEGDKIFIINLKQNPYKLETIGLPNASVPPEIEEFVKTYIDVDEIFESLLLNKLKELYKDLSWEFPSLNPNIKKFFAFS
jgi:hypothetical protein